MRRAPSHLAVGALLPVAAVLAAVPAVAAPSAGSTAAVVVAPRTLAATAVASGPVTPAVRQVPVRGVAAGVAAGRLPAGTVALSPPVPAQGYATVGAVWNDGGAVAGQQLWVRTRTDGRWTGWQQMHADAEHGPDRGTDEARGARPGTDPYVVGAVDDVQLRASAAASAAPRGLTLVVVDPDGGGTSTTSRLGAPAYPATPGDGAPTPRPGIYSRAQWGADERLRDGFAGYGEVSGSFVHHTVNANDYTSAEVPAIIRAIYAYHVQGRGWSDIGYNFLVDRFGRVWEGRWGGIGRPVIGAHTLGYNEEAFAMSAIGNYDVARPTPATLKAYGRLFAWKLSLHGVDARSDVRLDGDAFHAVNGHRDAASTACPGRYLYDRLGTIRAAADKRQHVWSTRGLRRSVVGDSLPDLLVRDDERLRLRAGDADPGFHPAGRVPGRWASYSWVRIVGDWDGDGRRDLMARQDGRMWLFPGDGEGGFDRRVGGWAGWDTRTLLTPLGDWDGDGRPDLAARVPGGAVWLFAGRGSDGLARGYQLRSSVGDAKRMLGVGRWTGDGAPDLMTRDRDGRLWLWPGNGPGGLLDPRQVATGASAYDLMLGVGDLDRDGDPDLVGRNRASGRLYLLPAAPSGLVGKRVAIGSEPLTGDMLG